MKYSSRLKYILWIFIMITSFDSLTSENESDHFNGELFFNPGVIDKNFSDVIKWWWSRDKALWPESVPVNVQKVKESSGIAVTFIGHSTFLIQYHGINILTDPIWSDRASPVSFAGPKRVRVPGVDIDDLPKIDLILISHNHYDHMDLTTLKKLEDKYSPTIITGIGNSDVLIKNGNRNVIELDWWHSFKFKSFEIVFTPAQHFSARTPFDRNKTLWGSFVIVSKLGNIYFAGDTGFSDHFKKIGDQYGPMILSLLPIGAYEPRWFMKTHHTNPHEAVIAHKLLKSKYSLGMHFGTFQLTDEAIDRPIIDLKNAIKDENLLENEFEVLEFGQTKELATF